LCQSMMHASIKKTADDTAHMEPIDVENASFQANEAERMRGSPFYDLVVAFMFCAYMCLMVLINSGPLFLLPLLLQDKTRNFGIVSAENTDEQNGKAVAQMVGILTMPMGLTQVGVAIGLFVPMTKRFGDVPVMMAAGLVGSCIFPLIGFLADEIWKLVCLNVFLGGSFGFLAPALGPVAARYGSTIYPKQMALVQGIPLVGLQLSNAFAQSFMAIIVGDIEDPRLPTAYIVCGCFSVLFTIFFCLASSTSSKRVAAATVDLDEVGKEKQGLLMYQAMLRRSPASVGLGLDIAPLPVNNPVMRRAMSVGYAYGKHPVNKRSKSVPARPVPARNVSLPAAATGS